MERKASLFMDDVDYVIRTGTVEDVKVSQATLRGRTDSISEDNLDTPLGQIDDIVEETPEGLEEAELAEHAHGKEYTATGSVSSPSSLEVEMPGSKVLPSMPTHATTSNRFSYASQGPSSTPQHYHSGSLTSSSDKQTAGMEANPQESPLLSRQQGAGWPLLLTDRTASSVSVHLGGGIQFDSERFEQCISAGQHDLGQGTDQASQPASTDIHQGHGYPYMYEDDTRSIEDEHAGKLSLTSSIVAVQGDSPGSDPRSYTPSSVVSSSVGGGGYTHQRSWVADDASESDVEGQQQHHTAGQAVAGHSSAPHMLRRIHSDLQMWGRPSEPGAAVSPSLKHTSSVGPDRFEEVMKRRTERRKSYKDFHGYPSINEWFEDIWMANLNSQQPKEEEEEPKGRPTTLA